METHPKCSSVQISFCFFPQDPKVGIFPQDPKWEHINDFKESVIQADLLPLQLPFGFTANERLNSDH